MINWKWKRSGRKPVITVSASDRTKRLLLHIPVGLVTGLACWQLPVLGVAMLLSFIYYEQNEDWHIRDQACWDVAGFIWGLGIVAVIISAYLLIGNV